MQLDEAVQEAAGRQGQVLKAAEDRAACRRRGSCRRATGMSNISPGASGWAATWRCKLVTQQDMERKQESVLQMDGWGVTIERTPVINGH